MMVQRQLPLTVPILQSNAITLMPCRSPSLTFHTDETFATSVPASLREPGSAVPRYFKLNRIAIALNAAERFRLLIRAETITASTIAAAPTSNTIRSYSHSRSGRLTGFSYTWRLFTSGLALSEKPT